MAEFSFERSFLNLPYHIRRHIYSYLGLIRFCPVDLNAKKHGKEGDRQSYTPGSPRPFPLKAYQCHRFEPVGVPIPWPAGQGMMRLPEPPQHEHSPCYHCRPISNQLFLVSRGISEDALSSCYSENSFIICASDYGGFQVLESLGSTALKSLTSLRIRMNKVRYMPEPGEAIVMPLECLECSADGTDRPLRGDNLNQLKLFLPNWASLVNKLAKMLQPSRIKLQFICDMEPDEALATSILEPLYALPVLKKFSIKLGRPDALLQRLAESLGRQLNKPSIGKVSESNATFPFTKFPSELQLLVLEHSGLVSSRPMICGLGSKDCCCGGEWNTCYCYRNSAAYSPSCTCHRAPSALFRVNHQMREQAMRVLYAKNRFYIRFDQGLKLFRPGSLRYVRHLQVEFPLMGDAAYYPGHPETTRWHEMIKRLREEALLSNLTLVLDLSHDERLFRFLEGERMVQAIGKWKSQIFRRVFDPLIQLKGLKNLFIYLDWPPPNEGMARKELEQSFEKEVMGDEYDSSLNGKGAVWKLRQLGGMDDQSLSPFE